jgi:hypothetical protein
LSLLPNTEELLPKIKALLKEQKQIFQQRSRWSPPLVALERSLEFNKKIPTEERKRFNLSRLELAISWAPSIKTARLSPVISATLKKYDEHFEIYLLEYEIPSYGSRQISWEDDGIVSLHPYPQENPYWQKRKAFYERELANPCPIYTENQLEYIRTKAKELERMK